MKEPNKKTLSDVQSAMLIIVVSALIMLIINKIFHISFFEKTQEGLTNLSGQIQTGEVYSGISPILVSPITGTNLSGQIQTGEKILTGNIIPDDARGFIDYIIKRGINDDYIFADLYPQPFTHSINSTENTALLFKYIYKYRYPFKIPENKQSGYILITLNNSLDKDRDIFLAVNGSSIGPLIKNKSEDVWAENEYLYPIDRIPAKGLKSEYNTNLITIARNQEGVVYLGGFTSESGNGIKNITMVFK